MNKLEINFKTRIIGKNSDNNVKIVSNNPNITLSNINDYASLIDKDNNILVGSEKIGKLIKYSSFTLIYL